MQSRSTVKPDAWYAEDIKWAFKNGVIQGYVNGKIGHEEEVTRAGALNAGSDFSCEKSTIALVDVRRK